VPYVFSVLLAKSGLDLLKLCYNSYMKTSLTHFANLLKQHDWHFEYTSDHSVWTRGRAARNAIRRNEDTLLKEHSQAELNTIWNEYAPSDFKRK
jgi:hypothetical protein